MLMLPPGSGHGANCPALKRLSRLYSGIWFEKQWSACLASADSTELSRKSYSTPVHHDVGTTFVPKPANTQCLSTMPQYQLLILAVALTHGSSMRTP